MAEKTFSRQNIDFLLYEVLDIDSLTQYDYFKEHDVDTFGFILDAAADIADKVMRPAYVVADRHQPELVNGEVKVHQSVHDFFKTFCESGFMAAPFPAEWGGQQLPKTVEIGRASCRERV